MKFRPLHDRVVVTRIDAEDKTAGGIIIPDTAKEKPSEGEVIAVDARNYDAVVKRAKLHINPPKCLFLLIFLTVKQRLITRRKMKAASRCLIGVPLALFK